MQDVKPLTEKQKQALDFINLFVRENGYSPSLQEIADRLGKKLGTAQYLVNELKMKGHLKKNANKARGISTIPNQHSIALLGYIAAGKPIEPIESPEEISLPENIKIDTRYPHYALRVRGDSMIDMGILDNDTVLVRHQMTANNGDVVVAVTEKGATLKVFKNKNGKYILEPKNKYYPIIEPKRLEIRGKFIGLTRST